MAKSVKSMIEEAQIKIDFWRTIDDDELKDRNKTRHEANLLVEYFEGRYDALCDAQHLIKD